MPIDYHMIGREPSVHDLEVVEVGDRFGDGGKEGSGSRKRGSVGLERSVARPRQGEDEGFVAEHRDHTRMASRLQPNGLSLESNGARLVGRPFADDGAPLLLRDLDLRLARHT